MKAQFSLRRIVDVGVASTGGMCAKGNGSNMDAEYSFLEIIREEEEDCGKCEKRNSEGEERNQGSERGVVGGEGWIGSGSSIQESCLCGKLSSLPVHSYTNTSIHNFERDVCSCNIRRPWGYMSFEYMCHI